MNAEPIQKTLQCDQLMPQEGCIAAWRQLVVTFMKLQRRIEDMLAPYGLALSQFEALAKIGLKPGMIQQELVGLLLMTKGNVGALLDRLQTIELVDRRSDPNDRRANRLYLTPAGETLVAELFEKHCTLIQAIFKPLNTADRETLEKLLKALEPVD
jgi:DNA-binding MarR family transcriptional regulator